MLPLSSRSCCCMKTPVAKTAFAIAVLSVCAYAFMSLRGPNGLHALFEKKEQIRAAEKRNAELAKEIERKREHIKRLEGSPAEQELEIRDRLKLVHPNDKVYVTGEPEETCAAKAVTEDGEAGHAIGCRRGTRIARGPAVFLSRSGKLRH